MINILYELATKSMIGMELGEPIKPHTSDQWYHEMDILSQVRSYIDHHNPEQPYPTFQHNNELLVNLDRMIDRAEAMGDSALKAEMVIKGIPDKYKDA